MSGLDFELSFPPRTAPSLSSAAVWLFDSAAELIGIVTHFDSVITTVRYREHSEFSGTFPVSQFAAFEAASFAVVADEPEVYLVERVQLTTGPNEKVEVRGRSASALLTGRTIEGTKTWEAMTAGAMIADMMADFTGDRALALSFGSGTDVGAAFSLQRSWGECAEAAIEILAAKDLGMRTRLDGTAIRLDVFAASDADVSLGEKYRDGSTGRLIADTSPWRNFAYVRGAEPAELDVAASSASLAIGTNVSGSLADTVTDDGTLWTIGEVAGSGLSLSFTIPVEAAVTSGAVEIKGRYAGSASHNLVLAVLDPVNSDYETATTMPNATENGTFAIPFEERHIDRTNGIVTLRILHNVSTYNNSHRLYLDHIHASLRRPTPVVEVDQVGDERRELYVDASDLQQGELTTEAYEEVLAARGAAKLAESRRLEYAQADDCTAAIVPGDVVYHDAGVYHASFMATEVTTTREKGSVTRSVALGEPPATLKTVLMRRK